MMMAIQMVLMMIMVLDISMILVMMLLLWTIEMMVMTKNLNMPIVDAIVRAMIGTMDVIEIYILW